MTFESIHEKSVLHWRMGKLSLLDEYETRTFLPPPLNLPWVLWLVSKYIVGLLTRWTGIRLYDDTPETLKAQEHAIIVEIFQDRLCDQYLANCHGNVDQDYRLDQIEAKLSLAQSDIKFFKARNMSSSLRVERKYFESAIRNAMAKHPLLADTTATEARILSFEKERRDWPSIDPDADPTICVVKSVNKHKVRVLEMSGTATWCGGIVLRAHSCPCFSHIFPAQSDPRPPVRFQRVLPIDFTVQCNRIFRQKAPQNLVETTHEICDFRVRVHSAAPSPPPHLLLSGSVPLIPSLSPRSLPLPYTLPGSLPCLCCLSHTLLAPPLVSLGVH